MSWIPNEMNSLYQEQFNLDLNLIGERAYLLPPRGEESRSLVFDNEPRHRSTKIRPQIQTDQTV